MIATPRDPLTKGFKVHLRTYDLHGCTFRVVSLRPQTTVRFSTNYFHDTWHILAGVRGAELLGRLLWGLAFQRQPGTLVLIDGDHLVPTPFDADPPDPILLVPAGLTSIDLDHLRALKQRLRRVRSSPTTIRWHTFGMPAALARDDRRADRDLWLYFEGRVLRTQERMSRRAGFVCYTAPPPILRSHALGIHTMQSWSGYSSYHPLAESGAHCSWHHDGEFQLIPNFDEDVSAAIVGRREVLGEAKAITTDAERYAVYDHKDRAFDRLQKAREKTR
jgi:hypothetical protein